MIAAPWYVFAGGTILVIVSLLLGGMGGSSKRSSQTIHHKMRDEDIIRQLNESEALTPSAIIGFLGYLAIFISAVWRLVLFFV